MHLTLGFSPCPNDTFIFDALVNGKIDTGGLSFNVVLDDVQTLNQWALEGRLQLSKISYGVWPLLQHQYRLLRSGGALGEGVGPLLVARDPGVADHLSTTTVAIPGRHTTAHLLFSLAFPQAAHKIFKVFHEIEDAVLSGEAGAGVIIHENRFTYQKKGLVKLADLGALWEEKTQAPVPLGGIVARADLPAAVVEQVDQLIRQSVEYAFAHYPVIPGYVKQHAQEMDEDVMRQHIDLYVNHYSIDLGEAGLRAVEVLTRTHAAVNAGGMLS